MSDVLARVQELVARNEVRPSLHGFRELAADGILLDDLLGGIEAAVVIEDYRDNVTRWITVNDQGRVLADTTADGRDVWR